jgi:hypothetical protein
LLIIYFFTSINKHNSMKQLFLMAFVCTFALASCTNTDTSQPAQNIDQTQAVDSTAQAADTTAQSVATEQPAAGTKVTKTEKPASGGGTSTKGNATTPKGDATTPKGEVSKPEGNNSDRGASVTTGSVKNTRDAVNPAMREDNVKNQKDRNVTPVKP